MYNGQRGSHKGTEGGDEQNYNLGYKRKCSINIKVGRTGPAAEAIILSHQCKIVFL